MSLERANLTRIPDHRLYRAFSFGLARIADVMMPPQCAACAAPLERTAALCPRCWSEVSFIERPYCARLGIPFPYPAWASPFPMMPAPMR